MKYKYVCMQYVNRIRCSAKHLSLASSQAKVAPVCATHYLPARKERSCTFMILVPAGPSEHYFGALGAH